MVNSGPLYDRATTMCYGGIIAAAAGNALALRTDRESIFRIGFFGNRLLLLGLASVGLILLALSYTPFPTSHFPYRPPPGHRLALSAHLPADSGPGR